MRTIREEADERGSARARVDARALSAPQIKMSRFFAGEHIAEIWGRHFEVAARRKPEMTDTSDDKLAVNQGAPFAVVWEEGAALQSMLQGPRRLAGQTRAEPLVKETGVSAWAGSRIRMANGFRLSGRDRT